MDNKTVAKHKLRPYNVTPAEVIELIDDLQRARQALSDTLIWLNSDDVKGLMAMGWVHGAVVPLERAQECADMWARVKTEAGE